MLDKHIDGLGMVIHLVTLHELQGSLEPPMAGLLAQSFHLKILKTATAKLELQFFEVSISFFLCQPTR